MTQNGRGGAPRSGAPWGPDPAYPGQPEYREQDDYALQDPEPQQGQEPPRQPGPPQAPPPQAPQQQYQDYQGYQQPQQYQGYLQQGQQYGQEGYGQEQYPQQYEQQQPGPAYGYPPQEEPGQRGGEPGYGYPPPLHEAATQYIAPVPASGEDATQYIPPVPASGEDATQYIPHIPPVPSGPAAPAHAEAATQFIPPVPPGPGPNAAEGFDGLFRGDDETAGHTQHMPPIQEPVLRQQPPRARPPRGQGPAGPGRPMPPGYQDQPHQPQPQYAPPPPPPAGRKVSPAVIAAVITGLVVVGLGVGALLSDGKAQNTDPGAEPAAPTGTGGSAAAVGQAPVDPARPQAVQLDKLLAESNDSRAAVIKAVDDIKGCANLGQAADDLRAAALQREQLVTKLQDLKMDKLPNHVKLAASLTKAWNASAAADNSYAAWADDVDHDKGNCKDGKAKTTPNAGKANASSGEATRAKQSAATMWNSIAGKYELTKRDKSQL
ncbi:hypothetical protein OS965_19255 [Streptomyces sp. H27-G5]|uniref:hypothetical protein n=1 Tax=Streptomyces sp. H27-G5 TaxID=2996698 RepID=UPI00226FA09B|nr:hypothetical protein [Streptomyces sp. H27-G5]MCY0920291.1 hypothetical protein [Streptomyces sp. H27-G5]